MMLNRSLYKLFLFSIIIINSVTVGVDYDWQKNKLIADDLMDEKAAEVSSQSLDQEALAAYRLHIEGIYDSLMNEDAYTEFRPEVCDLINEGILASIDYNLTQFVTRARTKIRLEETISQYDESYLLGFTEVLKDQDQYLVYVQETRKDVQILHDKLLNGLMSSLLESGLSVHPSLLESSKGFEYYKSIQDGEFSFVDDQSVLSNILQYSIIDEVQEAFALASPKIKASVLHPTMYAYSKMNAEKYPRVGEGDIDLFVELFVKEVRYQISKGPRTIPNIPPEKVENGILMNIHRSYNNSMMDGFSLGGSSWKDQSTELAEEVDIKSNIFLTFDSDLIKKSLSKTTEN